jgi:hypothetical protein
MLPDTAKKNLCKYATAAQQLGVPAAIAVSAHVEQIRAVLTEAAPGFHIEVLHVPAWGAFVPALNALLGLAQQRGMKYILYHSLEVTCAPGVLERLLDHFTTTGMLVAGPVLDGHTFEDGEQPLNGRTTPWNTLALWSVRKLALTGFLSIADGLPEQVSHRDGLDEESGCTTSQALIGTVDWWTCDVPDVESVPAGVEEVTAIALLQRILGAKNARAVLLQLPDALSNMVSWKTDWGQDVQRRQWHEYKMASKVARPAAQMKKLFSATCLCPCARRSRQSSVSVVSASNTAAQPQNSDPGPMVQSGSVMHFGESIRTPMHAEYLCLFAIFIFSTSFTSALAAALHDIAAAPSLFSLSSVFPALTFAAIVLPMPASLWLIRWLTQHTDHKVGLLFVLALMAMGSCLVMYSQLSGHLGFAKGVVSISANIIQGMASGVFLHTRFILAASCTSDHHSDSKFKQFSAIQLGLGFGVLLALLSSVFAGWSDLLSLQSELIAPAMLMFLSFVCFAGVLVAFPSCLHVLPRKLCDVASVPQKLQGSDGISLPSELWNALSGTNFAEMGA